MSRNNMILGKLIEEVGCELVETAAIRQAADVCAAEGQLNRAAMIPLNIKEICSADHLLQVTGILNSSIKERTAEE